MNAQGKTKDLGSKDGVHMILKIIPFRLSQETCTNTHTHKQKKQKIISVSTN